MHPLPPTHRLTLLYDRLYSLRRGKSGDHERPHKPALLLSLIDLVESGHFGQNRFVLDDSWRERFDAYFEIVRKENDQPNIHLPYYHLSGDSFWQLKPVGGNSLDALSAPSSFNKAQKAFEYASIDQDLWQEMNSEEGRSRLREALIARYFPTKSEKIASTFGHLLSAAAEDPAEFDYYSPQAGAPRSSAFRNLVAALYDHQCVACGLRVRIDQTITFVDAAHIIPFSVSRNDHPSNGLALCKNHHWAMDQHLIALDTDLRWRISSRIDPRRSNGEAEIHSLNGHLILNQLAEPDFRPNRSALQWRLGRLLAV